MRLLRVGASQADRRGPLPATETPGASGHEYPEGLERLAAEREKLLRAYYADAISLSQLKAEQDRIGTETTALERELGITEERLEAAHRLVMAALNLLASAGQLYEKAGPEQRRKLDQALFRSVNGRLEGLSPRIRMALRLCGDGPFPRF